MKKNILFLLFSVVVSAQKTQYIELRNSIKDKNHIAKSLTLLDKREDKNIGIVSHRKDPYEVKFEKDDLEKLFSDWFSEDNKIKGSTPYFLMLEDLKVNDIVNGSSASGHLEMKVSTFLKKGDNYYFLKRSTVSKTYRQRDHAYITRIIAAKIGSELATIIKDSYAEPVVDIPLAETDLSNYQKLIIERLPVFKAESFIDGVYKDYKSFAEQKPDKELEVRKNKDGIIKGVKRVDGYDNLGKDVFAIIDNGIAYKKTPTGIIEIEKDNDGIFITASEEELFPEGNTYTITGAAMGGVIGGLVGGIIDVTTSAARKKNAKYFRIGIDPLTGEYILPESFDKYK